MIGNNYYILLQIEVAAFMCFKCYDIGFGKGKKFGKDIEKFNNKYINTKINN